jgi:ABC-type uncharacterized transport system substrate-binding protein
VVIIAGKIGNKTHHHVVKPEQLAMPTLSDNVRLSSVFKILRRSIAIAALVAGVNIGAPSRASAHPHVFVTAATTVLIKNGTIDGFQHVWTFDEMYTAMAVEGLDTNGDAKYSREELSELAKVNIEGLKEFGFFTQVTLAGKPLEVTTPTDYWLEHKDGVLALHFKLPLSKPVLADAKNFAFAITDPSFFIAFDLAKTDPVRFSDGAPTSCKVQVGNDADSQSLTDALSKQLGSAGFSAPPAFTVHCEAK